MELLTKPTSSLEDIADLITQVEELIDSDVPLTERKDVSDLMWVLQHRVSDAASQLMTGVKSNTEMLTFADYLRQLIRLTGAIATDIGNRVYDQTHDSGKVIWAVVEYIQEILAGTIGTDYIKRLEVSPFEKAKQWFAHRDTMVDVAASAAAITTATIGGLALTHFLNTNDSPLPDVETIRRGGLVGLTSILGGVTLAAARKSAPRKIGGLLGSKIQTSSTTYALMAHLLKNHRGESLSGEELAEKYAERDLGPLIPLIAFQLLAHGIDKREDIARGIEEVLYFSEVAITDSYGVDFDGSLLDQFKENLSSDNLDNGMRYKYIEQQ